MCRVLCWHFPQRHPYLEVSPTAFKEGCSLVSGLGLLSYHLLYAAHLGLAQFNIQGVTWALTVTSKTSGNTLNLPGCYTLLATCALDFFKSKSKANQSHDPTELLAPCSKTSYCPQPQWPKEGQRLVGDSTSAE